VGETVGNTQILHGEVIIESAEDTSLALFGTPVRVDRSPALPMLSVLDLRREWQQCFERWMLDTATSEKTLKAYSRAWEDLLLFCEAIPSQHDLKPVSDFWNISHRYIRAWMDDLATRPLDARRVKTLRRRGHERTHGYAKATIGQYLAAVSSFFSYVEHNWPVTLPDGREVTLLSLSGIMLNPVRVIKRRLTAGAQKREQAYLTALQLRRFLRAIPQTTALGLRDRALFMLYIMTGGRNSEVRTLQWQDFQERGERMFWHWRGKGRGRKDSKDLWKELPPECWAAIKIYLQAAGRWDNLQAENYVFTALGNSAANLPGVSALQWDPHAQPLTSREVNRLVKKYAARAELDPEDVHVHTLRHSAAMLMDQAGADPEEIRKFLNHESLNTTQGYLHKMKGERNVHAGQMAELLGL